MPKTNVRKRRRNGNTSRHQTCRRHPRSSECDHDLVIQGCRRPVRLNQQDLLDEELVASLRRRLDRSDAAPTFVIRDLIGWPDAARWTLFAVVAGYEGSFTIRFRNDKQTFHCLFDAVLHVLEDDSELNRYENSRRAALEAAAMVYGDRLDSACRQILRRFQDLGVRGLRLDSLIKQARDIAGQGENGETLGPQQAAQAFQRDLAQHAMLEEGQPTIRYYQDAFYVWSGRIWKRLDDKQFRAQLVSFLQEQRGVEEVTDRFVRDVVTNLQGMTLVPCWERSLPMWIQSEKPFRVRRSPYRIFQNGMLNLDKVLEGRRMKIGSFHPANFNEVILPYDYDRRATCPLWEETLAEIFPRRGKGDRRICVLQEFMGWTLVHGDTTFAKFLILVGKGGNGKSTILHVWQELLGRENVSHVPLERFNGEFRLHEMTGKLANISGDMNRVEKVEEGLLKELTSGDPIQVNRKFKSPMTMTPTARLVFGTNALPPINDKSDGMWRRIIAMPFFVSFEGRKGKDRRRAERLPDELPGIFNWAVKGARRLYERNRFSRCKVCEQCADEHRFHSDPFRQFIEEECVLGENRRVEPMDLYSVFRKWCDRNGRKAVGSSEFAKRLEELSGVSKSRPGSGKSRPRYWLGLGLQKHSPRHF